MHGTPPDPSALLAQGMALLRRGERVQAEAVLRQAARLAPHNPQIWLWLSGAVADEEQRRTCLQRVLALDPGHAAARRGLALLAERTAAPATAAPISATPATPATPDQSAPTLATRGRSTATTRRKGALLGMLGVGLVLICGLCAVLPVLTLLGRRVEAVTAAQAPPPGWQRFSSGRVSIWLPQRFVGGDARQPEHLQRELERADPLVAHLMLDTLRDNQGVLLLAVDRQSNFDQFVNHLLVLEERAPARIRLETYMRAALHHAGDQVRVLEQEVIPIGAQHAGRIVLEQDGACHCTQLVYIFKSGSSFWSVLFSSASVQFDQLRPLFEQSVQTFAVAPDVEARGRN